MLRPETPQEKIAACKANIQSLLDEIEEARDLDLWQEADGKLNDLLIVYREKGKPAPPNVFTFSDGITRNIDRMAFDHAYAEACDDDIDGDDWPAMVQRGGGS